jgi:hypothetical protein
MHINNGIKQRKGTKKPSTKESKPRKDNKILISVHSLFFSLVEGGHHTFGIDPDSFSLPAFPQLRLRTERVGGKKGHPGPSDIGKNRR